MIGNYLLLTFRNLGRHKLFTAVNIVSLAVGMSWWLFAVPVAVIVAVTLATVSGRILITLRANPIRPLKAE